jgi:hypothetical protein
MQTRRALLVGAAAIAAAHAPPTQGSGFVTITDDGTFITSPMPADESIVEVMLIDGSICSAWYSCNIMEAGDWDFLPATIDDDLDYVESIADRVIAWRR